MQADFAAFFKKIGYCWKRWRRVVGSKPSPEEYARKRGQLQQLLAWYALGHIDLRFGDETNFSMTPNVPYGWLKKGQQTGILSNPKRVLNVFSLMNLDQQLCSYPTTRTINADFIIQCLDDFAQTIKRPTVLVLDNAGWHTARAIRDKACQWQKQGLFIWHLPTYSPHLNPIEILWRKIKYEWLKPKDYQSDQLLKQAICNILTTFGTAFQIDFSKNFLSK